MLQYRGKRKRPVTPAPIGQLTKPIPVPAPTRGINAVDGLIAMAPDESVVQYNIIPSQYGARVRTGYREFATDVGTGGIRTVIPFSGSTAAQDRLFACAEEGIFDVSSGGAGPWSEDITFPSLTTVSGYGQWVNTTTIAGHFCLYTDETNGYYVYDEGTGTWSKVAAGAGPTQISGVDPALFAGVVIFKSRIWFIEKDSARAWYLDAGTIFGAATEFNFGNKFPHGGTLVALYNWTVDGGEGIDDYLVAISSSGDVIVYKGNDPDSATDFFQHGSWFIGAPPAGRRIGGSFGGEVYLLSQYGLLPMSRLISGTLVQKDDIYLSRKITPLIQEQMAFVLNSLGWEVKLIPTEQLLAIVAPKRVGFENLQFVQSLNNEGWGIYRDIPWFTGDNWQGTFYVGSTDNIVYTHLGDLDNVNLADTDGDEIEWSVIQTFQDLGEPGLYHRAQFIRPVFLAEQAPSYVVEARYDYNLNQIFGAPSTPLTAGATWDTAIWDTSVWEGDFAVIDNPVGGSGMGRAVAVAINGRSQVRTILIRYDLMADTGGML